MVKQLENIERRGGGSRLTPRPFTRSPRGSRPSCYVAATIDAAAYGFRLFLIWAENGSEMTLARSTKMKSYDDRLCPSHDEFPASTCTSYSAFHGPACLTLHCFDSIAVVVVFIVVHVGAPPKATYILYFDV